MSMRAWRAIQRDIPASDAVLCGSVAALDTKDIVLLRLFRPRAKQSSTVDAKGRDNGPGALELPRSASQALLGAYAA